MGRRRLASCNFALIPLLLILHNVKCLIYFLSFLSPVQITAKTGKFVFEPLNSDNINPSCALHSRLC